MTVIYLPVVETNQQILEPQPTSIQIGVLGSYFDLDEGLRASIKVNNAPIASWLVDSGDSFVDWLYRVPWDVDLEQPFSVSPGDSVSIVTSRPLEPNEAVTVCFSYKELQGSIPSPTGDNGQTTSSLPSFDEQFNNLVRLDPAYQLFPTSTGQLSARSLMLNRLIFAGADGLAIASFSVKLKNKLFVELIGTGGNVTGSEKIRVFIREDGNLLWDSSWRNFISKDEQYNVFVPNYQNNLVFHEIPLDPSWIGKEVEVGVSNACMTENDPNNLTIGIGRIWAVD